MKAVAIKLDDEERARLAALATAKQRSAHFLMRDAIREYLDREESRHRFIAAAEASYEHYKETGMHVTLDEFSEWVNRAVEDVQATPPKCHE
jgi:predicted transcriptional regulator